MFLFTAMRFLNSVSLHRVPSLVDFGLRYSHKVFDLGNVTIGNIFVIESCTKSNV